MSTLAKLNINHFDAGCVFCRMKFDPELSTDPANELLYCGQFHYVVCGLGAWTPGYVLLITHQHLHNFSLSPDESQSELNSLVAKIEKLFLMEFGEVTIFEHGAIDDKRRAGGCVNHAHLHFLAKDVNLCGELNEQFRQMEIPSASSSARHLPPLRAPYLYVKERNAKGQLFIVDQPLTTQFLRQKVASKISMHRYWDYKLYPFEENMMKTIGLLRGKFE
jgi:diadenosine tetraphosphate (Ap4A) HIT family hydrolase